MTQYSIKDFVEATAQDNQARGTFQLENPHLLEVNLNGMVRTKIGSMIAYVGEIKF
jgi:hypothetical protein